MKKIILFLLLLTSLYSDAKIYMGTSIGYFNEKFQGDLKAENSSMITSIKIAYGDQKAYGVELSFDWAENKSKIFSKNDGNRYGANIEFIKSIELFKYIYPFLKVGVGYGTFKINRTFQERMSYSSLNLGAGTLIPINEHLDFEIAYVYKHLSYEKVETIIDQMSYKSGTSNAYLGLNIRF